MLDYKQKMTTQVIKRFENNQIHEIYYIDHNNVRCGEYRSYFQRCICDDNMMCEYHGTYYGTCDDILNSNNDDTSRKKFKPCLDQNVYIYCNYANGKMHGLCKRFNHNGELVMSCNYVNGVKMHC